MSPWGQQSPQVLLPSPEAVAGTFPGQQAGSGNEILPKSKAESSQSDERGVLVWACCRQFLSLDSATSLLLPSIFIGKSATWRLHTHS